MALVLPRTELAEDEREAEVDVRRGRVDPELHAQRPAELQLLVEAAGGKNMNRMARRCERLHVEDFR